VLRLDQVITFIGTPVEYRVSIFAEVDASYVINRKSITSMIVILKFLMKLGLGLKDSFGLLNCLFIY